MNFKEIDLNNYFRVQRRQSGIPKTDDEILNSIALRYAILAEDQKNKPFGSNVKYAFSIEVPEEYPGRLSYSPTYSNLYLYIHLSQFDMFVDEFKSDEIYFGFCSIFKDLNIPWDKKRIKQFAPYFGKLCINSWAYIFENEKVFFDIDLINSIERYVKFDFLSNCQNFNWTEEFIEKNKNKLKWENLSANPSLPWSPSFLELYKDKWCWGGGDTHLYANVRTYSISINSGISWNQNLFDKYKNRLDLWTFIQYANFPPSLLISNYEDFKSLKKVIGPCHRSGGEREWEDIGVHTITKYCNNKHFLLTTELMAFAKTKVLMEPPTRDTRAGNYYYPNNVCEKKTLLDIWIDNIKEKE